MQTKKCSKCKEIKPIEDFYKDKSNKYGLSYRCKECVIKHSREYYKTNAKKVNKINIEYRREYRKMHPEETKEKLKEYYKTHFEMMKRNRKKYEESHSEKIKEYRKVYIKNNIEKIREQRNIIINKGRLNPMVRLNHTFSEAIRHSLKNNKNGNHWGILVGYMTKDLIKHLENKFKEGMNWGNQGKNGWEIDHIIPICLWKFDSYTNKEFKQCWALCNLQPLWANENRTKYNRLSCEKIVKEKKK